MMRTNRFIAIFATLLGAVALTISTDAVAQSTVRAASYVDDLYGVHDREALAAAEAEAAAAEAAIRAESERRIAAMVAAANAEADIDDILGTLGESTITTSTTAGGGTNVSIYNNIYVDDYSSAYARRLQGFTSLTYRLPSSYYDYRYGDAYFLTLAYDPAFYTVMVMGDQVWVEPRYITNMFGSWNNPYYYGYRYGYNPYYYGYSYCYYDPWRWNSPYWGCDPYYHYHYHHYWHDYHHHYHHYHDHHVHRPGYHNPSYRPGGPGGHHGDRYRDTRVEHRPSYGSAGSVSYPAGGRPTYNERLGGRTTDRGSTLVPGANSSAGRGGAVGNAGGASSTRPGTTVTTSGRPNSGTESGRVTDTSTENNNSRVDRVPIDGTLSKSLNATTLRGNASTGRSNSSSRVSSGSSSSSSNKSSSSVSSRSTSSRSSGIRSNSSSSNKSSGVRSSSSSSSNRSSSSRSSVSSSSRSSSRSSSASSSRSSSSSSRSSSGSSSSSSSRGSSRR